MHKKNSILHFSILVACCLLWPGLVGWKGIAPLPGGNCTQLTFTTQANLYLAAGLPLGIDRLPSAEKQNLHVQDGIIPDTGRPVNNLLLVPLVFVAVIGIVLVILGILSKG